MKKTQKWLIPIGPKRNPFPGGYVAVEGQDASGISTQAKLLAERLKERGFDVLLTAEPTDEEFGQIIRKCLRKKEGRLYQGMQLQRFFAIDRHDHQEGLVIPHLRRGGFVVSARAAFSSFAFGAVDECNPLYYMVLNADNICPDLSIFLDVSTDDCLERIGTRPVQELFEEGEKLRSAKLNYLLLCAKYPDFIRGIDGDGTVEEVHRRVSELVEEQPKFQMMLAGLGKV